MDVSPAGLAAVSGATVAGICWAPAIVTRKPEAIQANKIFFISVSEFKSIKIARKAEKND